MRPHVRPPVADLPDTELLGQLHRLVIEEREFTAELLLHLGEVDARQLYRRAACSSMFTYCLEILHYSENMACKRIAAARAARRYPHILDLVAAGRVHLSAVCLVAPHLDDANHAALLAAVVHKSKREAEEIVAAWFPKPDAAAFVRRVPCPSVPSPSVPCPSVPSGAASEPAASLVPDATAAAVAGQPAPQAAGEPASEESPPPAPSRLQESPQPQIVSPLSADRFRIQFTASRAVRDKLRQAQDLLRHATPRGDLEVVFERALDALLKELRQRKFGEAAAPRSAVTSRATAAPATAAPAAAAPATAAAATAAPSTAAPATAAPATAAPAGSADQAEEQPRRRRPIARARRREVAARDGHRCAYVDAATGKRCSATTHLRFHHRRPWALGGGDEADNLELRCAAHDGLAAEEDYGPEFVARKIAAARTERAHARALRNPASAASGATVPGNGAPVTATGPTVPGDGAPVAATGPTVPGAGAPVTATGPTVPGAGAPVTATGPTVPGDGAPALRAALVVTNKLVGEAG